MGLLMLNGIPYSSMEQPGEIYSTEEREIGVWVDGKPLYQRSHVYTAPEVLTSNTYELWDIGTNITLISGGLEVLMKSPADGNMFILPYASISTASGSTNTFCTDGKVVLEVGSGDSWSAGYKAFITIKYTKDSDTPGSGQWLPSGDRAHHYSTDEQIVGTWIDGKPLYETTIVIDSGFSTQFTYTHGIANIDETVKMDGMMVFGTYSEPLYTGTAVTLGWDNYISDVVRTHFDVHIGSDRLPLVTKIYVILTYTKTTD